MNDEKLWIRVLDVIRVSVSLANFNTWFSQTFIAETKEGKRKVVTIACPSSFVEETLQKRYLGLIQDSLNQVTGQKNDILFTIKQNGQFKKNSSPSPLFSARDGLEDQVLKRARIPNKFSFDNYAVSPANQLAWSAALSVAKNPGSSYNPLFVWGGVGVGKTHLAFATAREILTRFPEKKVLCSTGDEFIVGIIDAIRTKTTSEFKKRYRGVDVLVIDDIGFIAGKDTVQDEFFHTYNQIQRDGGQVVMTSDRPPFDIPKLEDRLRNRFEGGLIVDISPPDFELRVAILLIKAKERGIDISIDLAQKIAEAIPTARQIDGFLVRLLSQIGNQSSEVTVSLIEDLLKTETRVPSNGILKKTINTHDIVTCVCNHFSVSKKLLAGRGRKKILVVPRHILMYLLRTELNLPLEEIGKILGGRDHTTIMHGVERVSNLLSSNERVRGDILGIKNRLWG